MLSGRAPSDPDLLSENNTQIRIDWSPPHSKSKNSGLGEAQEYTAGLTRLQAVKISPTLHWLQIRADAMRRHRLRRSDGLRKSSTDT